MPSEALKQLRARLDKMSNEEIQAFWKRIRDFAAPERDAEEWEQAAQLAEDRDEADAQRMRDMEPRK